MGSRQGDHRFGGDWTTRKLDVLAGYLRGYTTALKRTPFRKAYIDAFAGTGYRTPPPYRDGEALPFPDLAASDPQTLLDGSARMALRTVPRFDRYIFIEQSAARCASLERLQAEFPDLAADISVRRADANSTLRELCTGTDWSTRRAVVFLDPYGMQVDWETITAIAATRAIDLWILFPLGMGVNRMLKKDGDIPATWRLSLDALLGTTEWYDEFYRVVRRPTFFGDEAEQVVKASTDTIGRYFNGRLKTVFAGVADQPAVLRNSTNSPLYLLCFAVGNERGRDVALRIANYHLLKDLR